LMCSQNSKGSEVILGLVICQAPGALYHNPIGI
jgi:hypothetical protein